jgi:hypothetical protein
VDDNGDNNFYWMMLLLRRRYNKEGFVGRGEAVLEIITCKVNVMKI